MSTLHLKASVENGRLVADLPPELAATAANGATFNISVDLPPGHDQPEEEDVPLPGDGDGPEAFRRFLESLSGLGNIQRPPQDGHLDLPRHAWSETD